MNLSKHFTYDELIHSNYAIRHGLSNNPSPNISGHLKQLADALEEVRALLNAPITISSGYRSMELNRAIGGSGKSAHMEGYAADFICPNFGLPKKIVRAIVESDIKFDQVICEGTWVHFSIAPAMRREALNATFRNGKAQYTEFV
jgi:uncharacterized protein YcbK (DUF882 family)